MSRHRLSPRTERILQTAIDLGERLFVLLLFAGFAKRLSHTLDVRPYNLLALVSEGLVAYFIIVRRNAKTVTMRPWDWVVALTGTALAMYVRPGGHPLLPSFIGATLMFAGISLAILSKLTLRKSLGIAAANRGPVLSGPYRIVRHPMYVGYVLVYMGFLLNNPIAWNLAMYVAVVALLVARILAEEAVLNDDPVYSTYRTKVRFRLVPHLF